MNEPCLELEVTARLALNPWFHLPPLSTKCIVMGTLEDLPSEVIVHIYTQLPIPDRLALSRVRLPPHSIQMGQG
jgi:hypothetical protein